MNRRNVGKEIVMPALEMSQEKGLLVRWLKAEGQFVHKGEPLMEIETDKALTEIESPDSGVLSQISARPGEEVPVGQVIAVLLIRESEESVPQTHEIAASQNPTPHTIIQSESLSKQIRGPALVDPVPTTRNDQNAKTILASPKARRLAAQAGIDLSSMPGSGPDRAILTKDILALSTPAPNDGEPEFNTIEVRGMRRIIADRLQHSAQEAPHITLSLSVDMSRAKDQIRNWNTLSASPGPPTLTMTSLICKAVVTSLLLHRKLNSHFLGEEIREYRNVHLGVAVALDEGLVVPVIRNAEKKDLASIQTELAHLANRARLRQLQSYELKGSTFTLSNLGMFGIEQFTAILNPPEVGILSVGMIKDTPIAFDGQVVLRPLMHVSISVDHRAVDGAVAARFLGAVKKQLEDPASLFTQSHRYEN